MICVYGIKNCDTIKKARKWLDEQGIEYRFHDYRVDGLERGQLVAWARELGWEALLNKRGTTWRAQPDAVKNNLDEAGAIDLMLEHPAMIKRPLLDTGDARHLGFKAETWATLLAN